MTSNKVKAVHRHVNINLVSVLAFTAAQSTFLYEPTAKPPPPGKSRTDTHADGQTDSKRYRQQRSTDRTDKHPAATQRQPSLPSIQFKSAKVFS